MAYEGWEDHDNGDRIRSGQPAEFIQVRTFLSRKCTITNETIWPFQKAWRKQYFHYYNNEMAFELWICNKAMVFAKLKDKEL